MLKIIWTFEIKPDRESDFLRHYAPDGTWAELFRKDSSYKETSLMRDKDNPVRFLTVDSWDDYESYSRFLVSQMERYELLDAQCEELTTAENLIGYFTNP